MKRNVVFIEYANKEQVKWWNNVASKAVKVKQYTELIDTETNKAVGVFFVITGILTNYIIRKNNTFMPDSTETTVTI